MQRFQLSAIPAGLNKFGDTAQNAIAPVIHQLSVFLEQLINLAKEQPFLSPVVKFLQDLLFRPVATVAVFLFSVIEKVIEFLAKVPVLDRVLVTIFDIGDRLANTFFVPFYHKLDIPREDVFIVSLITGNLIIMASTLFPPLGMVLAMFFRMDIGREVQKQVATFNFGSVPTRLQL